ncbi:MAG TPA: DMT family transporter [Candidatus Limnocylindrales bacterium]|nr:DMT family transporter [Candidatus Limnocylindrales bacterium]
MSQRGVVLFGMMAVIWGIPYLFIRIAVAEVTPATLVFARTGIAALILLPIAIARVDLRAVLAHWRWVLAFAVTEVAIPWVMLASAEQHLSSSLTGLLIAGVPLVGTVLALATGGADRTSRTSVAGLLVGLVGVAAIVGADLAASDATALLEVGVVVVGYAIGPAILARRLAGVPSVGVMAIALGLTALVYLPFALTQLPSAVPSPKVLASIVILAVVCTALAFIVFAALIKEIGPVRSTVITYINPAVAAVLGILVLNETFSLGMGAGLLLVICGSILATRRPATSADPPGSVTEQISAAPAGGTHG